jgi:cytochrome c oxidase subunit 2
MKMKFLESLSVTLMALTLFGTVGGIFGYERFQESRRDCVTIRFRTYEHGNPTPNTIHLKKGQPACLRLTSEDTTHALNIPDMKIFSDPIHPGKWTYVHFTPEKSGTFSFVCTIVCSPMHSRVRGKIIVDE